MPLSAAERAKHYRGKNKGVFRNRDNLYRKVMDPIKMQND